MKMIKNKNMKNLLTFVLIIGTSFYNIAQDASEKDFQAGLTLGGAMSFNSPQTNTIDSKVGGAFIAGMTMDWNFLSNIGLTTGLEFEFDKFTTTYNEPTFFQYADKDIIRHKDREDGKAYNYFLLDERAHNSIYLTIPVMLKFQTNYLGYVRYFGRFGIRNSFNLMSRTTNTGTDFDALGLPSGENELKDMKSKGINSFYKGAVGISAGAEYNITGNTVLVAELGYYYGFSEIFAQRSNIRSLYQLNGINNMPPSEAGDYYVPTLKQGQLLLKVSVLF